MPGVPQRGQSLEGEELNIAVLSLTRDRIAYTRHCFPTLRINAGTEYDWFTLDQGSEDGTVGWLLDQPDINVTLLNENIGICRALNLLLDEALNPADYDVIVRFDNDCEAVTPGILNDLAQLAVERQAILAPHIHGLRNPPPVLDHKDGISHTGILGGIFMVIPATIFSQHGFRYDEQNPPWTGDEAICPWWAGRGGTVGFLDGYHANHYLTTDGQAADVPEYFERRVLEGGPAR